MKYEFTDGELVDRDFGPRIRAVFEDNSGRKVVVRTGLHETEPTMTASVQAQISVHHIIKALEHIARHGDYTRITQDMGKRIMDSGAEMVERSVAAQNQKQPGSEIEPQTVLCKNCGSQIFEDQFDNGGTRWVHGHSSMFACGTADGIQTIAEPLV